MDRNKLSKIISDVIYKENQNALDSDFDVLCNATEYLADKIAEAICKYNGIENYGNIYKNEELIMTIDDIVRRLNDGLSRTEKELEKCKQWLLEYQLANDMTLRELDDLCFENSDWVFEKIFG